MTDVICEKSDGCYIPATDCGHGKRHGRHACKMLIHGCSMLKCIPVDEPIVTNNEELRDAFCPACGKPR